MVDEVGVPGGGPYLPTSPPPSLACTPPDPLPRLHPPCLLSLHPLHREDRKGVWCRRGTPPSVRCVEGFVAWPLSPLVGLLLPTINYQLHSFVLHTRFHILYYITTILPSLNSTTSAHITFALTYTCTYITSTPTIALAPYLTFVLYFTCFILSAP